MARRRLGEVLLEHGLISRAQLDQALVLQRQTRHRLGEILVERGILTEIQLITGLGEALGIPVVNLRKGVPDKAALKLLKPSFCELNVIFPLGFESAAGRRRLVLALTDPLNLTILEEVSFLTGIPVTIRLSTAADIRGAISQHLRGLSFGDAEPELGAEEFVIQRSRRMTPERSEALDEAPLASLLERPPERYRTPSPAPVSKPPPAALRADLDYLMGADSDAEKLEAVQHRFWTLMRLLVRKGVISQEEFNEALERGE